MNISSFLTLLQVFVAVPEYQGWIEPKITRAETTQGAICLLSWDAAPTDWQVEAYKVFQAETTTGPWTQIAQIKTNELNFIVEPGKHFWHVTAVNIWNKESIPSAAVNTPPLVGEVTGTRLQKIPKRPRTVELPPTPEIK